MLLCGVVSSLALVYLLGWLVTRLTCGVCESKARMDGKTVIITGANSGIGFQTALDLAWRGARVIMACRNLEKAHDAREEIVKETQNSNVVVKLVDLSCLSSVRSFAEEISNIEGRLDVLIHNAGVLFPREQTTREGLSTTLATNLWGPFLLTHLLIDLLKKTGKSRIVVVASSAYLFGRVDFDKPNPENMSKWKFLSGFKLYCLSKFGTVLLTKELARRLGGCGVSANCLHPGCVSTTILYPLPSFIERLLRLLLPFLKTIKQGAQTTIHLAVSEDVEGVSGKYFSNCKEKTTSMSSNDEDLARKYWKVCEEIVQLRPSDPRI